MKIRTIIILFFLVGLISCRKEYRATEIDLANYGWSLYEEGNFTESNQWFIESVNEDSTYKDGYNGIGWSFGKMMQSDTRIIYLDSSVIFFERGLAFEQDENIVADVKKEILAGLCFAYNAKGADSLAIVRGDSLTLNWTDNTTWSFSHDTTITHLDVYIALAASYFSVGDFAGSLAKVQLVLNLLTADAGTAFVPDINTIAGRLELADEIEYLQDLLNLP